MSSERSIGKLVTMTRVHSRAGWVVSLSGVIDDSFDREALTQDLSGVVIFDLSGITRITSFGVREWSRAFAALGTSYVGFTRCSPSIVAQFNMVVGFGGRGQLLSLFAPFICDACGAEFQRLIDLRHDFQQVASMGFDQAACDCGKTAELDDIAANYFSFSIRSGAPTLPPAAVALLDGTEFIPAAPFSIDKEVEGELTALWLSGILDKPAPLKRLVLEFEGQVLVMAERLEGATPRGLEALGHLTSTKVAVTFARVPVWLALRLNENPSLVGTVKFVSFKVPARCQLGHVHAHEVSAARVHAAVVPPSEPCPECSAETRWVDPWPWTAFTGLPWSNAEGDIERYLLMRKRPPLERAGVVNTPSDDDSDFGRYRIQRRLGVGGMAEVFLARQTGAMGFERSVVVKRILPHLASQPELMRMFLEEARMVARLSHPNVVQIYDFGESRDRPFIAMEFVRGWDLNTLLTAARGTGHFVPLGVAARLASDLASGLHAAHCARDDAGRPAPIIHRDVSPHNVLVSNEGVAKIADFGVAKSRGSTVDTTDATRVRGKIAYMPLEVLEADKLRIDHRIDIYAAGLIFYQLLVYQHPFRRNSEAATVRAVMNEQIPDPRTLRPNVPEAFAAIALKATARTPDERYQTAAELSRDLENAMGTNPHAREDVATWLEQVMRAHDRAAPTAPDTTPAGGATDRTSTGTGARAAEPTKS